MLRWWNRSGAPATAPGAAVTRRPSRPVQRPSRPVQRQGSAGASRTSDESARARPRAAPPGPLPPRSAMEHVGDDVGQRHAVASGCREQQLHHEPIAAGSRPATAAAAAAAVRCADRALTGPPRQCVDASGEHTVVGQRERQRFAAFGCAGEAFQLPLGRRVAVARGARGGEQDRVVELDAAARWWWDRRRPPTIRRRPGSHSRRAAPST